MVILEVFTDVNITAGKNVNAVTASSTADNGGSLKLCSYMAGTGESVLPCDTNSGPAYRKQQIQQRSLLQVAPALTHCDSFRLHQEHTQQNAK
jgi:hypothetical protein